MNKVVANVLKLLAVKQEYPAIKIKVQEEMPNAYGDQKMVAQVVQNLLTNALKYTKDAENPLVEIGYTKENGKGYYFVKDNGIGFDQIHEKRIFKLFNRLVSDAYEGSGIGLTIAKRIVKKHNGSIKVKSEVGVGSTFLFNLES